jgi:REP element-mobilizing transposase RayT
VQGKGGHFMQTRKSLRLPDYAYNQNGAYFVTICTKDKQYLFWKERVMCENAIPLSPVGRLVDEEIQRMSTIYPAVSVDCYVIMPNHVHLIIRIDTPGNDETVPTLSRIVKQFKGAATKRCGFPLWQRSYYDHVIRDDADYQIKQTYLSANPFHWREDEFYEEG